MSADYYEEALSRRGARPMDFTGKIMKGFVFVDPNGFKSEKQLHEWVDMGLEFVKTAPKKPTRKRFVKMNVVKKVVTKKVGKKGK
jgi:hypothetical protein